MAVNKFSNYPAYAKAIVFLYTVGYLVMMFYHISGLLELGLFARNTPFIVNLWYDALGVAIVPFAIIMLYAKPKLGLTISLGVMMVTFLLDALVRYVIQDDSYANWFYYYEMSFAIFVLASYPAMRILVKPKNKSQEYA